MESELDLDLALLWLLLLRLLCCCGATSLTPPRLPVTVAVAAAMLLMTRHRLQYKLWHCLTGSPFPGEHPATCVSLPLALPH